MNKPNKIIATDLDGTLFKDDGQISQRTLTALHRASSMGFETIAVTGRSWRTATEPLKSANCIDYIVCSNGAYLYQQSTGSILWHHLLLPDDVQQIISSITALIPDACFGWESETGFCFDAQFIELADREAPEYGGEASSLGDVPHYKIFVRDPVFTPAEVQQKLMHPLREKVEMSTSGAPFLELTSLGTHKGNGLKRLADQLGIGAQHIVAFGDNHNDIPMLQSVGTSVAMANAVDEVLALSDVSTGANSDDGVAAYIESVLLQSN